MHVSLPEGTQKTKKSLPSKEFQPFSRQGLTLGWQYTWVFAASEGEISMEAAFFDVEPIQWPLPSSKLTVGN